MLKKLIENLRSWLPLGVVICGVFGTILVVVQQNYRLSANDPQIQYANEIVELLIGGNNPNILNQQKSIDISKNLAPFEMAFDEQKKNLVTNGLLDGKTPVVPSGVFDNVKTKGEERFTWQPKAGVRIAAVMRHYNNGSNSGFVLVGRNLSEVEKREDLLTMQVFAGLGLTLLASFLTASVLTKSNYKK